VMGLVHGQQFRVPPNLPVRLRCNWKFQGCGVLSQIS
jgi:hypothetical protein